MKLTSHFANNKVTLFDFQLAEHMNQQSQVTQKWFRKHPMMTDKAWSSWKIFIVAFFAINMSVQLGVHFGDFYPSALQRGEKPQAGHFRPLIVSGFEFSTGGIRDDKQAA